MMKQALRSCAVDAPDIELDRFIRFVDKKSNGKIDYEKFFERLEGEQLNPERALRERL